MAIGFHYIYQENKPVEPDSDGASAAAASGNDNSVTNSEPSVKDVSSAYLSIAELYMTDLWWVNVFTPRFKYRLEKLGESVLFYHPVWTHGVVLVTKSLRVQSPTTFQHTWPIMELDHQWWIKMC